MKSYHLTSIALHLLIAFIIGEDYVFVASYNEIRENSSLNKRRLQTKESVLLLKLEVDAQHKESKTVEIFDHFTNEYAEIKGPERMVNDLVHKFEIGELTSNESTLMKPGAYFDDSGSFILSDLNDVIYGSRPHSRRRKLASSGAKQMLAVRVIAVDAATTSSEDEIRDSWFGTFGDPVNMKSQYEACSYGKLKINPANNGKVSNGVYSVTIPVRVNGASRGTIKNAVIKELGNLTNQFDHIMLCLPPGTEGNWIAYAYVNNWLSVYNDNWCNYVSAQMHEIGHNIGLAHSGEPGSAYGDRSGVMGVSYRDSDAPQMCFNAPKSSQLGWYAEKEFIVSNGWEGKLYGIADYKKSEADIVILKISTSSKDDWYVSFNRKAGANIETQEGGNMVLVHKRPKGYSFGESLLMEKMDAESVYNGAPLRIEVNELNLEADPAFVTVKIGIPMPVAEPTVAPFQSPPTSSTCSDSSSRFEVTHPYTGEIRMRTCDDDGWVKRKKTAFKCYRFEGVKEACPKTCLNCCEDLTGQFQLKRNKKIVSCAWVGRNISKRCNKPPARQLCAVTCGQCDGS